MTLLVLTGCQLNIPLNLIIPQTPATPITTNTNTTQPLNPSILLFIETKIETINRTSSKVVGFDLIVSIDQSMDIFLLILSETLGFDRPNSLAIFANILEIRLLRLATLNDFNLRSVNTIVIDRQIELILFLFFDLTLQRADIVFEFLLVVFVLAR